MRTTERLEGALAERSGRLRAALATPARTSRMVVVLGRVLGLAVLTCFLTGLLSHFLQQPLGWMRFPTWPNLYQVSQGIHLTAGILIFPLLLGKLWTVYPRLFIWPPITSFADLLERGSILVLVTCALLEPAIGLVNTYQWYPWPFPFRETHYAIAWVLVGAMLVHLAVKLPTIIRFWGRSAAADRPVVHDGHDA